MQNSETMIEIKHMKTKLYRYDQAIIKKSGL